MLTNILYPSQILSVRMPTGHFHKITHQSDRWIVKENIIDCDVHVYIDHLFSIGVSFLLLFLLHQALKVHCFKGVTLSTTSFQLTRSCMHFVQIFIFIILKSSFISFVPPIFSLPANPVHISFHSHNFLTTLYHLPFAVHGQTSKSLGCIVINYILISNYFI